jgi:hypothetical protein
MDQFAHSIRTETHRCPPIAIGTLIERQARSGTSYSSFVSRFALSLAPRTQVDVYSQAGKPAFSALSNVTVVALTMRSYSHMS